MGTAEIAVPTLVTINKYYNIKAVVTVPDKPQGRGLKMQYSPIKHKAIELGLNVLQPENLSDAAFVAELQAILPDIIIVFAFRILPEAVYKSAKIATFNIHTSLLPKYRGAAPINWAVINGEKISGLTTFILQEKVDTGNILLQKIVEIKENSTAGDLHDTFAQIAPQLTADTCDLLLTHKYTPQIQDEAAASPAPKIFRHNAKIDWNKDAQTVSNFINGYSPVPAAWTNWNDMQVKILRAFPRFDLSLDLQTGEFIIAENTFLVKCRAGLVQVIELQLQGKKPLPIADFLRGYRGDSHGTFL